MESHGLRRGNYLDHFGKIVKVETIDELSHVNHNPIPLTEEWLLKFGFENRFGQDYTIGELHPELQQRDMYIYNNEKGFFYDNFTHHLKHVHQLQNLYFALTESELKTA